MLMTISKKLFFGYNEVGEGARSRELLLLLKDVEDKRQTDREKDIDRERVCQAV